ncbi:MAG: hypothetical protein P9M13_03495 [Candidatus Ancaeobacter aquaticus]|nr:hypothetical protein [Candidatus Ancaeobacter aquaticus]
MQLSRYEKFVYTGCPWFFGFILTVSGIVVQQMRDDVLPGLIMTSAGLLCFCFYCLISMLIKVHSNDE